MLHLLWEFEWKIAREDVFSRREREREREENDGSGNGRLSHKVGTETTGAKKMAARDGYVYVGIDFTTDSRPVPVHLGNSRPVFTRVKP